MNAKRCNQIALLMLYSPQKNFLFVHIPKTAGNSLHRVLLPYSNGLNRTLYRRAMSWLPVRENPDKAYFRGHSTSENIRRKMPAELFRKLHKFAVVRNPYDHAVSSYVFTQNNPQSRNNEVSKTWDFSQFLDYFERKNKIMPRYQSAWITDPAGIIQLDRIMFLENLKQDFDDLSEFLGLTGEIELLHVNKSPRKDYRDYYDDALKQRVEKLYAPDFDNFGYDFTSGLATRNPILTTA